MSYDLTQIVVLMSKMKQLAMVTKGVASVSSPVRNLRTWNEQLDHASFTKAVKKEFEKEYGKLSSITVSYFCNALFDRY